MVLALLLLVPLTALALVLGMARLEEALLSAPAAGQDEPAAGAGELVAAGSPAATAVAA